MGHLEGGHRLEQARHRQPEGDAGDDRQPHPDAEKTLKNGTIRFILASSRWIFCMEATRPSGWWRRIQRQLFQALAQTW